MLLLVPAAKRGTSLGLPRVFFFFFFNLGGVVEERGVISDVKG